MPAGVYVDPEYALQTLDIPSGICVRGGELVYRVGELAPAPDTQVVVNCAGRTRSIIGADVKVLAGGVAAWRSADFPLETGETRMADVAEDIRLRPYEKDWGVEEAMQDYLTWELALVEQIERDGTARFRRRAEFD